MDLLFKRLQVRNFVHYAITLLRYYWRWEDVYGGLGLESHQGFSSHGAEIQDSFSYGSWQLFMYLTHLYFVINS